MCVPIGNYDRLRAEIARGRRAAGLDTPAATRAQPITMTGVTGPILGTPTTARAVEIRTPLGTLTFYVRERRAAPAQRLRAVITDLASRRGQTVPQMLESLAA